MGIEATSVSIPESATPLAKEVLPLNSQRAKEILVGTGLIAIGAAFILIGSTNDSRPDIFIGGLMMGIGLTMVM